MVYQIKPYSYEQAKKLNVVEIKPSTRKDKKIDGYKDKNYICSIGNIFFYFPRYIQNIGIKYANKRRKLYKQLLNTDRNLKNLFGYYTDKILW